MIYTDHPDGGAPMTLDLLDRCYLHVSRTEIGVLEHTIKVRPLGDEYDDWEWSFVAFRERVGEALRASQVGGPK